MSPGKTTRIKTGTIQHLKLFRDVRIARPDPPENPHMNFILLFCFQSLIGFLRYQIELLQHIYLIVPFFKPETNKHWSNDENDKFKQHLEITS